MARSDEDATAERDELDRAVGSSGLPGASTLGRRGRRLGIRTVRDLLTTFPKRYRDLREFTPIAALLDLDAGQHVTVRAEIESLRVERTFRRRLQRTTAVLRQGHHTVDAVWFGRRYIDRQLKAGDRVVVSGKL